MVFWWQVEGFLVALGRTQTVLLTLQPTFHISNVHEHRLCLDQGVVFCVLGGSWCFASYHLLFEEVEEGLL